MPDGTIDEPCEALAWDSEFWGFPIARVRGHTLTPERIIAVDHWCREHDIACLYFLSTFDDPLTVRCAEDGGFRMVDARVTFSIVPERCASAGRRPAIPGVVIRPAVDGDVEHLRRIAGESFQQTRFYFDLQFPRAKCRQLYEHWIAVSCRGYADQVFVADISGIPVGYATCHLPHDTEVARVGLINVAPEQQRRGIGRALREHAIDWFAEQHVPWVSTATQGRNIAMQVLNQRCGFVTQTFQLWYHKWYRLPEQEET